MTTGVPPTGQLCPIDLVPVTGTGTRCTGCNVLYHAECLLSAGGCATPGCPGAGVRSEPKKSAPVPSGGGPNKTVLFAGVGLLAVVGIVAAVIFGGGGGGGGGGGDDDDDDGGFIVGSTATPLSPTRPGATGSTDQASPSPTGTATPTPTAPPTPKAVQITDALQISTGLSFAGKAGNGGITISVRSPSGGVDDAGFNLAKANKDVQGNPVPGERLGYRSTDNTGKAVFEVPPGEYIILGDLNGYNWGTLATENGTAGIVVTAGQTTAVTISMGIVVVNLSTPDGGINNEGTALYLQRPDVNGKLVRGSQVGYRSTANTGQTSYLVTPGKYILRAELRGYNWGDLAEGGGTTNVEVRPAAETVVRVSMGRLTALVGANTCVQVYLQGTSSSGAPVRQDQVANSCADNTGRASFHLTKGTYAVRVRDVEYFGITVPEGGEAEFRP